MAEWSMDDVAAAGAELEARVAGDRMVCLGSDADLMLGPDLSAGRVRHRSTDLSGSKASRAEIARRERARARRELFHQNRGAQLPRSRWPGRPRSVVGCVWLVVWLAAVVVELSAAWVVRVSEPRVSAARGKWESQLPGWVWLVVAVVVVSLVVEACSVVVG